MNRALRAATIGALLLTPVTVSACSAGQLNQTSSQQRDKTGPMASVGNLSLREVELAYPSSGSYSSGDDAEVTMTIANGGNEADQLVSVSGDGFTGFRISGTGSGLATNSASGSAAATTTGSAAATTTGSSAATTSAAVPTTGGAGTGTSTPSPSAGTSAGSSATGSGIAGATGSPSAGAAPTSAGSSSTIAIPAQSIVQLGQNPTPHLFLQGLSKSLTPGQRIPVTFTFAKAGTVTVQVVVAGPSEYQAPTSSFEFDPAQQPATTSSAGQD